MTSNSDKSRAQNNNGKQKDLWANQQVSVNVDLKANHPVWRFLSVSRVNLIKPDGYSAFLIALSDVKNRGDMHCSTIVDEIEIGGENGRGHLIYIQ